MRAISLWQPWASLMAESKKGNETRAGAVVRGRARLSERDHGWPDATGELDGREPVPASIILNEPYK